MQSNDFGAIPPRAIPLCSVRMRSNWCRFLKWGAFCAFMIFAASFARAFHLRYKTARMHSQCAVLAVQINNEIAKQGDQFNLESCLASIRNDGATGLVKIRDDGVILDTWGNSLLFEWEGEADGRSVIVRSVGRDGIRGTADDFWRSDISRNATYKMTEQEPGTGQSASSSDPESEGGQKSQPEPEGRSR